MKTCLKPALGLLAITLLALPCRADVLIAVANSDFTSPATSALNPIYIAAGAMGTTTIPDWTFSNSESVGGILQNADVPIGQAAFFNNTDDGAGGFPVNTITYNGTMPTIAPYTGYTLTVALSLPIGSFPDADYSVTLLAGATAFPATATTAQLVLLPATSGYTNFYDLSVNLSAAYVLAHPTLLGQQLGIVLASNEDPTATAYPPDYAQTYFSDVRLSQTPEPSTWALLGVGALALVWQAKRKRLV